jgi:hypothetical protein
MFLQLVQITITNTEIKHCHHPDQAFCLTASYRHRLCFDEIICHNSMNLCAQPVYAQYPATPISCVWIDSLTVIYSSWHE